MNNTDGLKTFLKYEKGHKVVAECLEYEKPQVMAQALKILAALCFLSDNLENSVGTDKLLAAITKVAEAKDKPRFLSVVNGITKSANADLQVKKLSFHLSFCLITTHICQMIK